MKSEISEILLVEDEQEDVDIIRELLEDRYPFLQITVATDGNNIVNFLKSRKEHDLDLPSLILLDLNLPGKNGFEVLSQLKNDEELKALPVIIMSNSGNLNDIHRAYQMQVNSYVQKSVKLSEFQEKLDSLSGFWFESASLPMN